MKKAYKHFLIDTYCEGGYTYNDYVEYCQEHDETPAEEGSDKYWNWINDMLKEDWDCLLSNIAYSKNNGRVLIYGTFGRWDGKHAICPVVCDTLVDALKKCASGYDAVQAWECDGNVEFHGLHHDGTDIFYMRPLNSRAKDMSNDDIEESKNPLYYTKNYPEYLF